MLTSSQLYSTHLSQFECTVTAQLFDWVVSFENIEYPVVLSDHRCCIICRVRTASNVEARAGPPEAGCLRRIKTKQCCGALSAPYHTPVLYCCPALVRCTVRRFRRMSVHCSIHQLVREHSTAGSGAPVSAMRGTGRLCPLLRCV